MHLYDFIDRSCRYYNFTIKSLRSSRRKTITNASYNNLFCAPWRRHGRRNWSDGMKNIIVSSMKYNWNVYIYQLTDQIIFHECIFHIILSDTKLSYYKTIQTQSSIEISFQRLIQSSSTCLHPREHDAPYQKRILFVSVIRSWNAFDISTITQDRFEAWNRHVGDIETTFEPIAVAIVQAHILRYEISPTKTECSNWSKRLDGMRFHPILSSSLRIARYPVIPSRIVRWKENIRGCNISSSCTNRQVVVVSIVIRKGWRTLFRYFWSHRARNEESEENWKEYFLFFFFKMRVLSRYAVFATIWRERIFAWGLRSSRRREKTARKRRIIRDKWSTSSSAALRKITFASI